MKRRVGLSRRETMKLASLGSLSVLLTGVSPFISTSGWSTPAASGAVGSDWRFELPPLPYAEDALEPYIDALTMGIHHGKHHAGYTSKLNAAIEGSELVGMSIEDILADLAAVPADIRTAVRNNGGGYANHSLFWQVMSPDGGGEPQGALADAMESDFGGFIGFQEAYSAAAAAVFGSGWAWLIAEGGALSISTTANQDTPLMDCKTPILGIDVWEHAYYLHYQNRRADYIQAWFNVVNWTKVSELYAAAI
jgi:Fe-Mn family superoxide dismutase